MVKKKFLNFSRKLINFSIRSKLRTYINYIKNYNFDDQNKFNFLFKFVFKNIDIIYFKRVFKKKKILRLKKRLNYLTKKLIFV